MEITVTLRKLMLHLINGQKLTFTKPMQLKINTKFWNFW